MSRRSIFKLHYLPLATSAWFLLALIICYYMSVLNGHVYAYFPFISDTGASPPESCVFTQMMNIGALLLSIIIYVRYRQVQFALDFENIKLRRAWNVLALWTGMIFCIGLSALSNFQETAILSIHMVSASIAFGCGSVNLIANTRISFAFKPIYKKYPKYDVGKITLYLRLFLTICYVALTFIITVFGHLSFSEFTGKNITWWTEDDGGFQVRLVATFSEWILAIVLLAYISTATKEFQTLEYEEIRFTTIYLNENNKTNSVV